MQFIIIAIVFVVIYLIYDDRKCKDIRNNEELMLENPNVSSEVKNQIRDKHEILDNLNDSLELKKNMYKNNLIQSCKFENVYKTYKDTNSSSKKLCLQDKCVSYETNNNQRLFSISYSNIIDAKCDTTENLTAMRFIALGVLAFAFKKKTHYTVITYKDDLTNSDQQLIFRVDNPSNKDEFINNLLIKRNQYLM